MNSYVHYLNIISLLGPGLLQGNISASDWAVLVGQRFQVVRDVVYRPLADGDLKLDLYVPYTRKPGPAIFYIHGGGWQTGSKEQVVLWYLPYLRMGYRVVTVQYRLSGRAAAPAAVEDCRCAWLWVARYGAKYGIDASRLVVTGGSAGGHLALMTALMDESLDGACGTAGPAPRALAVVNYYGATDLTALLKEPKPYHLRWLSGEGGAETQARRLSPVRWVNENSPPVFTAHGDADELVPYAHARWLHEALERAGVANELVTVKGGAHGRHTWKDSDILRVHRRMESFLGRHGALPEPEHDEVKK